MELHHTHTHQHTTPAALPTPEQTNRTTTPRTAGADRPLDGKRRQGAARAQRHTATESPCQGPRVCWGALLRHGRNEGEPCRAQHRLVRPEDAQPPGAARDAQRPTAPVECRWHALADRRIEAAASREQRGARSTRKRRTAASDAEATRRNRGHVHFSSVWGLVGLTTRTPQRVRTAGPATVSRSDAGAGAREIGGRTHLVGAIDEDEVGSGTDERGDALFAVLPRTMAPLWSDHCGAMGYASGAMRVARRAGPDGGQVLNFPNLVSTARLCRAPCAQLACTCETAIGSRRSFQALFRHYFGS